MKVFQTMAAQGDCLIVAVGEIPHDAVEVQPTGGTYVVAHSETGHHHAVDAEGARYYSTPDPLVCYLRVDGEYVDLVHMRDYDTHETIRIPRGAFQIRRQREWTPEGWRRVED